MPSKDPLQAQRDLIHRIQTEGLDIAYEALKAVCKDPKAPAPAKAGAGASLFRAGGLFDKDAQRGNIKPPEEMTAEEIAARLAELRAQQAQFLEGTHGTDEIDPGEEADDEADAVDESDEPRDMFG